MTKKKGFTLLELVVVIIILGILAIIGFSSFTKAMERSRQAEARDILGAVRRAAIAYKLQYGVYPQSLVQAGLATAGVGNELQPLACDSKHYFRYWIGNAPAYNITFARRCRPGDGGKEPGYDTPLAPAGYVIQINFDTGALSNPNI